MRDNSKDPRTWRPTAEILDQIYRCAAFGFKENKIAAIIGLRPEVFSKKKKDFPEIQEVLDVAKAKEEFALATMVRNHAFNIDLPYADRAKDIKYLLDRRHHWMSEDTTVEVKGPPAGINFVKVSKRTENAEEQEEQ